MDTNAKRPSYGAVCMFTSSRFLSAPLHVSSSSEDHAARSSLRPAKRESLRQLSCSAPQTHRIHISTLFELCGGGETGISGLLDDFWGGWWRSLSTLPLMYTTLLRRTIDVQVPLLLYILELLLLDLLL